MIYYPQLSCTYEPECNYFTYFKADHYQVTLFGMSIMMTTMTMRMMMKMKRKSS